MSDTACMAPIAACRGWNRTMSTTGTLIAAFESADRTEWPDQCASLTQAAVVMLCAF